MNPITPGWTYVTYWGGAGDDEGFGIAVDSLGQATITGVTRSTNLFTTADAIQSSLNGTSDAFITQLTATGSAAFFSSYLGGSAAEIGYGVALDALGRIYLTGSTASTDFPLVRPFQGYPGGGDAFLVRLSSVPSPPVFTHIDQDTGVGDKDEITTDQTLILYGQAVAGSTVTVYRAGTGAIGTAMTDGTGVWNLNYTATVLPEGIHAFTATATVNGQTSAESKPFLVTIDRTGPAMQLCSPMTTTDTTPEVVVTASDVGGLPNDAQEFDYRVFIDVDLDGNNTFAGNELGYSSAMLHDDHVLLELRPSGGQQQLGVGSWKIRARLKDRAGNEGMSGEKTIQITTVTNPWQVTASHRSWDPLDGMALEQTGNVQITHGLDLDRSPGSSVGLPFLGANPRVFKAFRPRSSDYADW